jgi:1,4-alpha-glucan branching enzyme
MGFTRVTLLPVTEHPLDQSRAYQTTAISQLEHAYRGAVAGRGGAR